MKTKNGSDKTAAIRRGPTRYLNGLVEKVGSKDGTLGLLMNDKQLYYQLLNTVRSGNILVDDLKTHPKRYVNISVFGGKDKGTPLTAPLNDTLILLTTF